LYHVNGLLGKIMATRPDVAARGGGRGQRGFRQGRHFAGGGIADSIFRKSFENWDSNVEIYCQHHQPF